MICDLCGKEVDKVEPFMWRASSIALACDDCIQEVTEEVESEKEKSKQKISGTVIIIMIGMIIAVGTLMVFFIFLSKYNKNIVLPVGIIFYALWTCFVVYYLRKKI